MALTSALSRFLLLSWCCQRAWSQAALAHVGEDCFLSCWKSPGFCDWCGIGNACCALDDSDAAKLECGGTGQKLVFTGTAAHQCVKAAFLPGQQPPAAIVATGPTNTPATQIPGVIGKGNATIIDQSPNGLAVGSGKALDATPENCKAETCAWTVDFSCPSAPVGRQGHASNDGSLGFKCCCILQASAYTFGNGNGGSAFQHPDEFNVHAAIGATVAPVFDAYSTASPTVAVSEIGSVTLAPTAAPDSASQALLASHGGANVRVNDVSMVDTDFKPTGHHGPIQNEYANNHNGARKEGCVFGICADLDVNDPDSDSALQSTAHGVGVVDGVTNQLPSYDISVNADNKVNVRTIAGTVKADATGAYVAAGQDRVVDNGDKYHTVRPAETTAVTAIEAGTTTITVATQEGFAIGDKVLIGGVEEKTITGFGSLILDSPVTRFFSAGTAITKVLPRPAISAKETGVATKPAVNGGNAPAAAGGSSLGVSAGGSSAWSGANKGIIIALAVLACICITLAGVGAAAMAGRKKKRSTTDREAYLKNDFIERQPVYHEVPPTEEDGLMKPDSNGADMNRDGIPDALQQPQVYLQPTNSFPLQGQANAISFPGMPPIGGSLLLQPTAGSTYMGALPQGASMNMTTAAPYQNYASQSVYTSAPAAYSQQLGMTMPGAMLPQTTSYAQPQTLYR